MPLKRPLHAEPHLAVGALQLLGDSPVHRVDVLLERPLLLVPGPAGLAPVLLPAQVDLVNKYFKNTYT